MPYLLDIYDGQVPCSLTEPKVFEIVEDQVRRVNELFQPRTFFLSHDEIRVANWSEPERASGFVRIVCLWSIKNAIFEVVKCYHPRTILLSQIVRCLHVPNPHVYRKSSDSVRV